MKFGCRTSTARGEKRPVHPSPAPLVTFPRKIFLFLWLPDGVGRCARVSPDLARPSRASGSSLKFGRRTLTARGEKRPVHPSPWAPWARWQFFCPSQPDLPWCGTASRRVPRLGQPRAGDGRRRQKKSVRPPARAQGCLARCTYVTLEAAPVTAGTSVGPFPRKIFFSRLASERCWTVCRHVARPCPVTGSLREQFEVRPPDPHRARGEDARCTLVPGLPGAGRSSSARRSRTCRGVGRLPDVSPASANPVPVTAVDVRRSPSARPPEPRVASHGART